MARREHSVVEFTQKLRKKFPDQTLQIKKVKKEFLENNWLSDKRFCEAFIQHQTLTSRWGPRKIVFKLQEKGIEQEMCSELLAKHFPEEKQMELLKELVQTKRTQILNRRKTKSGFEVQQKIISFLVGKGYEFSVIRKVVEARDPSTR